MTSGTTCSAQIRSISRLGLLERLERGSAQVHLELAPLGDHVRPRSPVDHADVHGDARPATVEPLQRHDRVRGLEHRVASLLGFDAGVRRAAGDRDAEVGDPLACRDDVAVRARALQHERRVVLRRQLADHGTGVRRADLLVGVAHVRDRPEPVEARFLQHLGRDEARQQTALHVGDARAARDITVDAERTLGHGPLVEHRVHVTDQQHVGSTGAAEPADHQVSELRWVAVARLMRTALDLPAVRRRTSRRTCRRSRSHRAACTSRSRRSPSPPARRRTRRSGERRCRVGSRRPRGAV